VLVKENAVDDELEPEDDELKSEVRAVVVLANGQMYELCAQ
jgi:hypothetical protein